MTAIAGASQHRDFKLEILRMLQQADRYTLGVRVLARLSKPNTLMMMMMMMMNSYSY